MFKYEYNKERNTRTCTVCGIEMCADDMVAIKKHFATEHPKDWGRIINLHDAAWNAEQTIIENYGFLV